MDFRKSIGFLVLLSVISALGVASEPAYAKTKKKKYRQKRVDVDKLRKQYWRQEEEYDVVQNRIYSKSKKINFFLYGGSLSSDPFLSTRNLGANLGFHFTEYFSAHAIYWKTFSKASEALRIFESEQNSTANTNPPSSYYGGELGLSVMYGKLSLLGKAILYYDLHLLGGAGITQTETGDNFTQHLGIGQMIYVARWLAIRLDYRFMHYSETIVEKINPVNRGQTVGTRSNFTNSLVMGLNFLIL